MVESLLGRVRSLSDRSRLVALAALALLIRVSVVAAQSIQLGNDATDYRRLALSLGAGNGFGTSHFAQGGGPTALRPPLYPLVLSAVYKVFGAHVTAARLFGAVVGAVAVGLIVLICLEFWGWKVAAVAGLLAACYPSMIIASTSQMSETIGLPLELAAVLAAVRYRKAGNPWYLASAGLALGLAVLTRPNLIVVLLGLAVLVRRGEGQKQRWLETGALVAVTAIVLVPWLVRDRVVLHAWVPLTTQDGYVLAGTYNATTYADSHEIGAWRPANLDPADLALIRDHPRADEVRLNNLLLKSARKFAFAHPADILKVSAYNTARLFDLGGWSYTRAATTSEYGYPGSFGYAEIAGCLFILALAAAGLFTRRARAVPWSYWSVPVLMWVSMVPIEVLPRFRAVIDPYLVQLGALTLTTLADRAVARTSVAERLPSSESELAVP